MLGFGRLQEDLHEQHCRLQCRVQQEQRRLRAWRQRIQRSLHGPGREERQRWQWRRWQEADSRLACAETSGQRQEVVSCGSSGILAWSSSSSTPEEALALQCDSISRGISNTTMTSTSKSHSSSSSNGSLGGGSSNRSNHEEGVGEDSSSLLKKTNNPGPHLIAGCMSAIVSRTAVAPLERIKMDMVTLTNPQFHVSHRIVGMLHTPL